MCEKSVTRPSVVGTTRAQNLARSPWRVFRATREKRIVIRCCFYTDGNQHSAWTEYLDVEPAPGDDIEHDGQSYSVDPNPVHTWFCREEMILLSLTTADRPHD
jgi:hypothetical protein